MPNYYDNEDMNVKTVPERCREYYQPEDFVVVMNIDDRDFTYTIQRPENVVIHQPSAVTKELYYSKNPDVITLKPGQTRLVPAYEADWMIKNLMDTIVLRRRADLISEGQTPTESAMDPGVQHKYIKAIYQGKKDFMSDYNKELTKENTRREAVKKDLEDEPTGSRTRTANQTT